MRFRQQVALRPQGTWNSDLELCMFRDLQTVDSEIGLFRCKQALLLSCGAVSILVIGEAAALWPVWARRAWPETRVAVIDCSVPPGPQPTISLLREHNPCDRNPVKYRIC